MSIRTGRIQSLLGVNPAKISGEELRTLYKKHVTEGIPGLCFSSYEEGQEPGDQISAEQIEERIKIIAPHTKWVRTFSCTDGNELIPEIAKKYGLKVMAGAWLSDNKDLNEKEIANLIALAQAGYADLIAVGNEVLYRDELTEEELLEYLHRVKQALPNAQVGYVDAYYEFRNRPALAEACDVIYTNCYPFWEGCQIDYALPYMKTMYQIAKEAAKGKPVVITETGWPSKGTNFEASEPSAENFMRYFVNTMNWTKEENIPVMYFASFDEAWKVGAEGDVGAYWGIWDKDHQPKFH